MMDPSTDPLLLRARAAGEIGSEFDLAELRAIPSQDAGVAALRGLARGVRPVAAFASGREALRALLASVSARRRIVFPAYLCESLLQAVPPSMTPEFVAVDPTLLPQIDRLDRALAGREEETVVVHLGAFGARSAALDSVLAAAEQRGVCVIDDRTHRLLDAEPPIAARTIASLRKWLPLPDGGLCAGGGSPDSPPDERFVAARADAMTDKRRWLESGAGDKATILRTIRGLEHAFDEVQTARAMSARSLGLLGAADFDAIGRARRTNHDRLRAAIVEGPSGSTIKPLLPPLAPSTVPLGLPVLCDARDALHRHLVAHAIFCPVHWPLPAAVSPAAFPESHAVQRRLLTLVIDQRYGPADMDRVAAALQEFVRR